MNRSFQESDSDSAEDTTVSIKFVLLVRCRFMIFSKILDKAPNNCCAFMQIAYCRISDHVSVMLITISCFEVPEINTKK